MAFNFNLDAKQVEKLDMQLYFTINTNYHALVRVKPKMQVY